MQLVIEKIKELLESHTYTDTDTDTFTSNFNFEKTETTDKDKEVVFSKDTQLFRPSFSVSLHEHERNNRNAESNRERKAVQNEEFLIKYLLTPAQQRVCIMKY